MLTTNELLTRAHGPKPSPTKHPQRYHAWRYARKLLGLPVRPERNLKALARRKAGKR